MPQSRIVENLRRYRPSLGRSYALVGAYVVAGRHTAYATITYSYPRFTSVTPILAQNVACRFGRHRYMAISALASSSPYPRVSPKPAILLSMVGDNGSEWLSGDLSGRSLLIGSLHPL